MAYASRRRPIDPLPVFGLGLGGVNLVKDPVLLDDSELIQAQNAEPYREQGVAGIRKRPGLQRIVPAGSVTPTAAAGPILGSYTITSADSQNPDPFTTTIDLATAFNSASVSLDGGQTWTQGQTIAFGDGTILPNGKYSWAGSPYEFMQCYTRCIIDGTTIIGGHAAGQILVARPGKAWSGITVFGSGSADDTLVLEGIWRPPVGDDTGKKYAIVITTGGKCALYNPTDNSILTLPNFTSNALATGSPGLVNGRLWVANGTNISSIDPSVSGATWTDNAIGGVSSAVQLLGLANYGGNLYAGVKTSSTNAPQILKAVPAVDGTATITESVHVTTSTGPSYLYGPYVRAGGSSPLYTLLFNGVLGTLGGTDAGAADSTSLRMLLKFSGTWRADLDIQNRVDIFNGSNNRIAGPVYANGYTGGYTWLGLDNTSSKLFDAVGNPANSFVWAVFHQAAITLVYPLF